MDTPSDFDLWSSLLDAPEEEESISAFKAAVGRRQMLGGLAAATGSLFLGACQTNPPSSPAGRAPAPRPATTMPGGNRAPGVTPVSYPVDGGAGGGSGFLGRGYTPSTQPPYVSAKAAIVVAANTGKVLYGKNADTRRPVASTQKLLLGLMVVERGGLGQNITVQQSDTNCEPTKMGIRAGEVYQRGYLLKTVLIRSSNDIARCLGRDHSGSDSAFAAAMTRRARQLGMNNSYFTNSNGLPSPPGQHSTARDLSILAAACMRHSEIREAVKTRSTTFRFATSGKTVPVKNTNKVLLALPYCTGMKTGYTNAAGKCLVSSASLNGRNVIAVILGSQSPQVWTESAALLKWGLGV